MRKIDSIVIHHSATMQPNMDKLISSINNNHSQRLHPEENSFGNHIAYHYIINYDGEIRHTRPLDEIGYHASNWEKNSESIGICLSGNFDQEEPTLEHYRSLAKLINELKDRFGELIINQHNEFANKSCPWQNFDFNRLMTILMLFYEKLRRDNFASIPRDERVFKDPEAFLERMKELSPEEQFSEMTFLMAILAEKLGKKIQ